MDGFHYLRPSAKPLVGVLYAEDFDLADGIDEDVTVIAAAAPEPEVIGPSYSAEEIEAARRQAHAEGRREGAAAARAEHDGAVRQALAGIAAQLDGAREIAAEISEGAAEAIGGLLMRSLAAMLPELCARHGAAEIAAVMRAVMPSLAREPRIVVRISPQLQASVRENLAGYDPDLAARIVLTPAEAMAPGDVRIAWQEGEAVRDSRALWREIDAVLRPLGLLDAYAATGHAATAKAELPSRETADAG